MNQAALEKAMPWLVVIAAIVLWELGCIVFSVPEFILPRPSRIIQVLISSAYPIWFHASLTLVTTLLGFALSVFFGVVLGFEVGFLLFVYGVLYCLLDLF